MEFGIFSQMHTPFDDNEHSRFLREIEVAQAVDTAGFKYDWSPEHHFLRHYSHQPAPEVFLTWVAAKTKQIHVGTAITNLTAKVNHPARAGAGCGSPPRSRRCGARCLGRWRRGPMTRRGCSKTRNQ